MDERTELVDRLLAQIGYRVEDYAREKGLLPEDDREVWISVSDAARVLSVTRQCIYKWLAENRLRQFKIGSRTLLRRDEVLAFPTEIKRTREERG